MKCVHSVCVHRAREGDKVVGLGLALRYPHTIDPLSCIMHISFLHDFPAHSFLLQFVSSLQLFCSLNYYRKCNKFINVHNKRAARAEPSGMCAFFFSFSLKTTHKSLSQNVQYNINCVAV